MDNDGLAWTQILATVGILVGAGTVFGLVFIYSGLYNVAADDENWSVTNWVLETTREQSVEARLDEVEEPPTLDDRELLATGAEHYDAMCAQCHAAPGTEAAELAEGLHPPPPDLVEEGPEESPRELFWFTKHGIKMTGMPAWGGTHEDRTLWGIVGVIKQFDAMTEQEYQTLIEQAAAAGHHPGDGGHGHGDEASADDHDGAEPTTDHHDTGTDDHRDTGSHDHGGAAGDHHDTGTVPPESDESGPADHDHEH